MVAAVVAVALIAAGGAIVGSPVATIPEVQLGVAAAGLRSGAPVVERGSLPNVPWLTQQGDGLWIFGRGDRGPVRRLPSGDAGLAIDDAFVASVVAGPNGRSTVRLRDRDTGRLAIEVAAPIWVSAGAWTTAGLVVTGYDDVAMSADGGLLVVAPETGAITTLVPPGPFSKRLGTPIARGEVLVSPSGNRVASNVCGVELCDLQVVEVSTGRVSRPIHGAQGFLRAVTDETVIATDDAGGWISARTIADGAERWRIPNSVLVDPVALADGSVVGMVGSSRAGYAIAALDAAGHRGDLTKRDRGDQPVPRLWRAFSNGTTVVIASTTFEEALSRGRAMSVTVLDPGDGHAVRAAVDLSATPETVP